jgi:uncharacterized sulfatase
MRFALLFSFLLAIAVPAPAAPPNVVIILSDDQAWTDYGFMGHEQVQTPNLDKLAKQSAVYTRGYVPNSLCRPSLATIITGKYAHQHGITGNDPAPTAEGKKGAEYLAHRLAMIERFKQNETIPKLLATKGYISFQSGKWWEGDYSTGGFTSGMTHGDPARGGRHGDIGLTIGRQTMQPVLDFLDEAAANEKPFFLWYAPMLPHDPHNPPQRLLDKYKDKTDSIHIARYWAMVQWWDETCGTVLDHLDKKGLAENTIVIYLADNGWIQDPAAAKFAPRSKRSHYDGGLRTPIMIRWPTKILPRRDDKTLASSIDLMPTIAAACGVAPPADLPGVNLLELCAKDFQSTTGRAARRDTLFGDVYDHDVSDLADPRKGLTDRWCVSGDMKLIVPVDAKAPVELYDVMKDPFEKADLAERQTRTVAELKGKLETWWSAR